VNIQQRTIIREQDGKQNKSSYKVINFDNTPDGRILVKSKDKNILAEVVLPSINRGVG
jgi:hypothetical protein